MYTQKIMVTALTAGKPTANGEIYPPHVLAAAVKNPTKKMKIYSQEGAITKIHGYVSGLEFDGEHIVATATFRGEDPIGLAQSIKDGSMVMAPLMTSQINKSKEAYAAQIWGFQLVRG